MLVSIFAGAVLSESAYHFSRSDSCPEIIQKGSKNLMDRSSNLDCIKILAMVIIGTYASHYSLSIASKLLKNKHFLIQCPIRIASLVLGKYSHSIPFLVTSVCYFSRRDALHKWGMLLLSLYRRIENITAFLGGAVLNPIETIERFGEGLDQETRSLKAALRVIAGGAPPKAIQEMDDHLARFEVYFNQREGLILNYQEKLSGSREALNRITVEVSAYKGEVERNIEQLNQMFAELDRDDDGFLENLLKEALDLFRNSHRQLPVVNT